MLAQLDPRTWQFELPLARALLRSATPGFLVAVFSAVNCMNFIDRGCIPGAFESVGAFIRADLHVASTDFYIGVLQSTYIVGFAVSCVAFGHATHFFDSFKLVCLGLAIWVGAMLLSAWAPSYWVLVAARVLSGAGEGSFQTVVPPYIDDHAPPAKRGLWLALFFSGIPVGTALGNVYGGYIGSTLGWRWAFAFLGAAMVPFIVLIWHAPSPWRARGSGGSGGGGGGGGGGSAHSDSVSTPAASTNNALASAAASVGERELAKVLSSGAARSTPAAALPPPGALPASPQQRRLIDAALRDDGYAAPALGSGAGGFEVSSSVNSSGSAAPMHPAEAARLALGESAAGAYVLLGEEGGAAAEGGQAGGGQHVSFLAELSGLLRDPLFMSVTLGYAGFAAVLAGLASFGPAICLVRRAAEAPSPAPQLQPLRLAHTRFSHAITRARPTPPPLTAGAGYCCRPAGGCAALWRDSVHLGHCGHAAWRRAAGRLHAAPQAPHH